MNDNAVRADGQAPRILDSTEQSEHDVLLSARGLDRVEGVHDLLAREAGTGDDAGAL